MSGAEEKMLIPEHLLEVAEQDPIPAKLDELIAEQKRTNELLEALLNGEGKPILVEAVVL